MFKINKIYRNIFHIYQNKKAKKYNITIKKICTPSNTTIFKSHRKNQKDETV